MDELEKERSEPGITGASPQFVAASQASYVRTLLLDAQGLRPGWGFGFYVVAFLILQQFASALAWRHDLGPHGLYSMLLEEALDLVAAMAPALVLARVEHRPLGRYGLPGAEFLGVRFWIGCVWGFAAVSALMLTLFGLHAFSFGHVVLHGRLLAKFAAFWAAYFLLVGFFEEFLLRGYSLFTLARGIRFWPAAITMSCLFGLIHLRNAGEEWRGVLAAALIGLFFCLTLRRTGNLWFAVGFHAAWDWGETFFYSVPDSGMVAPGHFLSSSLHGNSWLSGGTVGPEGSVLCFVVLAVIWTAFDRVYREVRFGPAA